MNLRTYLNDFVDLVFPRSCAACNIGLLGNEEVICTFCRISLPRAHSDGMHADTIRYKFVNLPEVLATYTFLLFTKKGKVQQLLHALKYRGNKEVGVTLGQMFGQELVAARALPDGALILSVPLHAKKKQKRGYNQSDLLAEGISLACSLPWSGTILARTKYTQTQTGKSKSERRSNVNGVFKVTQPIDTGTIILVDDVLTTGATLEECINTLKQAGCKQFYILTIALAQH
ncbi:ComF family protein [Dyadobacter sandarakinus]|uniref:ComF family protein n=1 Tax=Dyadobacter sandarakinus TaxID=2747268 RepID=A0ABX7IAY5_9BACT|nr:phosphoribosyltransferase family protein [Dyadobacter sandarakinus]QRR02965.1 ComF family protein [Dyadobacter sandarakinus]